jgi:multisubunit Na+/H+ antiporter MnhE subunit
MRRWVVGIAVALVVWVAVAQHAMSASTIIGVLVGAAVLVLILLRPEQR